MSDLIKLLPESVANQIAAGEVVQRPASVVKELLENAVDAGATKITLIIKDAGRMLVQVIDNGKGMSDTDARMSFERHATSKITTADDLFQIHTLGFRGEALASIAAVAQVEMKTRQTDEELGTKINIEGSKFISQEACTCDAGTSIAVKNLFFNIPVRRNFLKSNTQELKHIVEEFTKVALINPGIHFVLYNNDAKLYDLLPESFKQRIVNLVNKSYKEKLIAIESETEQIKISGFVCKPEFAKKSKTSEQYFFVNNRFVRHQYLRHAVESTYQELLPAEMYPMFFIKIDIVPSEVDVNIHPTKTEVNFQDSRTLYAILKAAIRKAFGMFSMRVPSMDFDVNPDFEALDLSGSRPVVSPAINTDPNYNPFEGMRGEKKATTDEWKELYNGINREYDKRQEEVTLPLPEYENMSELNIGKSGFNLSEHFLQYKNKYIISTIDKGIIIIDQERAHERVLYEECLDKLDSGIAVSQIDMFPETITFSYDECIIINDNKETFEKFGFKLEKLGQSNYVISAHPASIATDEVKNFFMTLLSNLKDENERLLGNINRTIAKVSARKRCIKRGTVLHEDEMRAIATGLFGCKISDNDTSGNPTYAIIDMDAVSNFL